MLLHHRWLRLDYVSCCDLITFWLCLVTVGYVLVTFGYVGYGWLRFGYVLVVFSDMQLVRVWLCFRYVLVVVGYVLVSLWVHFMCLGRNLVTLGNVHVLVALDQGCFGIGCVLVAFWLCSVTVGYLWLCSVISMQLVTF